MNAAPVAMQYEFKLPFDDITYAIQWHVLGMFLPSFFTGFFLKRWGCFPVAMLGFMIMGLAAITGIGARGSVQFIAALALIGVGWNFCYLSGSYLLVQVTPDGKRSVVQGVNDVSVYSLNLLASLLAGVAVGYWGWNYLNQLACGIIAILFVIAILRRSYLKPYQAISGNSLSIVANIKKFF